jgi:hypothetical protein
MYSTPIDLSSSYLRSAVEASLDIKMVQVEPTINKEVREKCWFLTFFTVCKDFQPITFRGKLFAFFSMDSNSASNFAFYDTQIKFLYPTVPSFWLLILATPQVGGATFGRHFGGGVGLGCPLAGFSQTQGHGASLMLLQPSGDGYFRLCSSKSSFRGTPNVH